MRRGATEGGDVVGVVLFVEGRVVVVRAERPVRPHASRLSVDEDDLIHVPRTHHDSAVVQQFEVVDVRPVVGVGATRRERKVTLRLPLSRDDAARRVDNEHAVLEQCRRRENASR